MSLGSNEIDLINSRLDSKHNAIRFYPADAQIRNLHQLDVVVAGPDDANRLFVIDGQFDASLAIGSQGTKFAVAKETFSVLVGPELTNRQFVRTIATASIPKTQMVNTTPGAFSGTWDTIDVDADCD